MDSHYGSEKTYFHTGAEYYLVDNACALRAGLDDGKLTVGLGLEYHNLKVDYGQADYVELGKTERVTVSFVF